MDRQQIEIGIREIGPCTTGELVRHLCGENASPSEQSNIRIKLSRMHHSHSIDKSGDLWFEIP